MSHSHTKLIYHCIFSTKHRQPLLNDDLRASVCSYIAGILRQSGNHLVRAGGTTDHLHLLVELKQDTPIAEAMRVVKANSSKWVNENLPSERRFAWQTGYGAFSVSSSAVPSVLEYIDNQETRHRCRSFQEEYLALLERHGITCDERHMWD